MTEYFFKPGNTYGKHNNHRGGPVCIPKEVREQILKDTPLYFERLKQFALGPDKKIAMLAISEILSRFYGQPKQYIESETTQELNIATEFRKFIETTFSRVPKEVGLNHIVPAEGQSGDAPGNQAVSL